MNQVFSKESVKEALDLKLSRYFGVNPEDANKEQIYKATILTVKDILTQKRSWVTSSAHPAPLSLRS